MKQRANKDGIKEYLKRMAYAFCVIVLFHLVFMLVSGFLSHHGHGSETVIVKASEKEPPLVWYMPQGGRPLTAEAVDFLKATWMISRPSGHCAVASVSAGKDVLEGDESVKRSMGIRVQPLLVQLTLDSALPRWGDIPASAFVWSGGGATERHFDLLRWLPYMDYDMERRVSCEEWLLSLPVMPRMGRQPAVAVSRYIDNEWQSVDAEELAESVKSVLLELSLKEAAMKEELPDDRVKLLDLLSQDVFPKPMYRVAASVQTVQGSVTSVHLRGSSGDGRLDGLVYAWVLKRHANYGHHEKTGLASVSSGSDKAALRQDIEYRFEFRLPFPESFEEGSADKK